MFPYKKSPLVSLHLFKFYLKVLDAGIRLASIYHPSFLKINIWYIISIKDMLKIVISLKVRQSFESCFTGIL